MERDGILEHQGLRKQRERVKIQANSIYFLSPLDFSKFSVATEAKITTLSDVVLKVLYIEGSQEIEPNEKQSLWLRREMKG